MSHHLVVFFEGSFSDPDRSYSGHSLLQTAAWLVEKHGFDCSLLLWSDSRIEMLPSPLERAKLFQLEELPPSNLVSTIDLAGLASGVIDRFSPDLILFSSTPDHGSLHLLGAACAFLQPADFLFGIVSWSRQNDAELLCARPGYELLLQTRLEFPAVIGVTYHHGLQDYPLIPCHVPESLPVSGLDLELELIQMGSALMPEPVSILQANTVRTVDLATALEWFGSDEPVE